MNTAYNPGNSKGPRRDPPCTTIV